MKVAEEKHYIRRTRIPPAQSSTGNKYTTSSRCTGISNPVAHAEELQISVGPDTTSLSNCYFEKKTRCSRSGICPTDGRECSSNRGYLDNMYHPSTDLNKNERPISPSFSMDQQSYDVSPPTTGERQRQHKLSNYYLNQNSAFDGFRQKQGIVDDLLDALRVVFHVGRLFLTIIMATLYDTITNHFRLDEIDTIDNNQTTIHGK